ncbi:MAG: DUF982 domain-containing protein [Rhizobiaceae bacterium]
MGMFRPIIIVSRGGRETIVTSLGDAVAVMQKFGWAEHGDSASARAYRLVSEAIDGRCAPRKAFNAFVDAARGLGIAKDLPRSAAWDEFEAGINGSGGK